MSKIDKVHTSCKNCIFALYKDITQIGCKVNKIDMWENQEIRILEAFDEEKEFFIINGKKCPYKRITAWGNKYPKDEHIQRVESEVVLQYHAIVIATNNIHNINTTIMSLLEQEIKPKKITLINFNNIYPSDLIPLLQSTGIQWQIDNIVDDISVEKAIDNVVTFCNTPYYAIFYSGLKLWGDKYPKPEFTSNINKMVKEAVPFVLIKGNSEGSGQFIHTITHKILKGNKVKGLVDKIEENNSGNLIKKIGDICPNFPQ